MVLRATEVVPAGAGTTVADTVVLCRDDRHRRRLRMLGEKGTDFVLDLAEATVLHDGDLLLLDDGRAVRVKAAAEHLLEVRGRDPHHLLRLAWHLGNRHVPTAIGAERLLIAYDHVLADMIVGLGGRVAAIDAPFDPEGGAYAGNHGHGHAHDHSDDHGNGHHRQGHGHEHGHGHHHHHHHD
ncbi:MAG TPA: urease accessory protein UreE [Hyphomicrobiales bacterium]|nr:urease accessory protein UreE [Kaistiaceae bacterium]HQF30627.1 urease accessory protein UreE [Hyphomicrobiales bacterium]